MKRFFTVILGLALLLSLCGCGLFRKTQDSPEPSPLPTVAATPLSYENNAWRPPTAADLGITPFTDSTGLVLGGLVDGTALVDLYPGLTGSGDQYTEGATGDLVTEYSYSGGNGASVQLSAKGAGGTIYMVNIQNYDGVSDAHGIHCGMGFNEVTRRLGLSISMEGPAYEEPFSSGVTMQDADGNDVSLPPKLAVTRDSSSGSVTVVLLAPVQPYPDDMEPMDYVYQSHCSLVYTFDSNGALQSWAWYVGALAE